MKHLVLLAVLIEGFATAQNVEVARHVGGVDDYGAWVIGEIRNATNEPVEYVKVVASFYDAAGEFIGSTFAYTDRDIVGVQEDAPFTLGTSDIQEFDSYELQVEASPASAPPTDALTVTAGELQQDDFGWTLQGQVTNESDQPMKYVKVMASAYVGMRMVGTDFAYTSLDTLQPGQTSPFQIGFNMMLDQPSDYRLWVEGQPAD